jgi:hypothetical protein
METLTEITKAEAERREKAWRYEQLLNEQYRLTRSIQHLEGTAIDTQALEKIQRLAAAVPPNLITRGGRFLAGGFVVRDILASITGDALASVQHKEQARQTALTKARQDLKGVEAALAEFTDATPVAS